MNLVSSSSLLGGLTLHYCKHFKLLHSMLEYPQEAIINPIVTVTGPYVSAAKQTICLNEKGIKQLWWFRPIRGL